MHWCNVLILYGCSVITQKMYFCQSVNMLNYWGRLGTLATAYFQMIQGKKNTKRNNYLFNTVLITFSIFGFQNNISTLKTIIQVEL